MSLQKRLVTDTKTFGHVCCLLMRPLSLELLLLFAACLGRVMFGSLFVSMLRLVVSHQQGGGGGMTSLGRSEKGNTWKSGFM